MKTRILLDDIDQAIIERVTISRVAIENTVIENERETMITGRHVEKDCFFASVVRPYPETHHI